MTWKNTKAIASFFAAALAGVSAQAVTFVDIDKCENHKFPEEIRNLGMPVTLLHKHEHAHGFLVFSKDYKKSFYRDDVADYNACSWYLDESGSAVAYEYCEEKIDYNIKEIEKNLRAIEATGYEIYGTTVRPVEGLIELEREDGHVYVKEEADKTLDYTSVSETVVANGPISNVCVIVIRCIYGGCQGHRSYNRHVYIRKSVEVIDDLLSKLENVK